jgi:hypothetical protein
MIIPAFWLLPAIAVAMNLCAASAAAGEEAAREPQLAGPPLSLNVHIYGFSYHPDRQGVRRNRVGNEAHLGFGLNYEFHEDARGVGFVEGGFYRDSGRNVAKLAGVGYQFKLGDNWRLGGALVGIHSPTYNHGRFFVAPLPMVSYDLGPVTLNAIYAPRFKEYNRFAVFGFYFSIPFGR